jgi:hypothetical protein
MLNQDVERLLSSFGDHLLRNQLADSRHARYMVHWVRRYLGHPPPMPNATPADLMDSYLGRLRQERLQDWQLDQARQSVTAWQAWSGGRNVPANEPALRVVMAADGSVEPGNALGTLEHMLRCRHYSHRTMATYMDWARRFFDYLVATNRTVQGRVVVDVDGFQNFISHLATKASCRIQHPEPGLLRRVVSSAGGPDHRCRPVGKHGAGQARPSSSNRPVAR